MWVGGWRRRRSTAGAVVAFAGRGATVAQMAAAVRALLLTRAWDAAGAQRCLALAPRISSIGLRAATWRSRGGRDAEQTAHHRPESGSLATQRARRLLRVVCGGPPSDETRVQQRPREGEHQQSDGQRVPEPGGKAQAGRLRVKSWRARGADGLSACPRGLAKRPSTGAGPAAPVRTRRARHRFERGGRGTGELPGEYHVRPRACQR